MDIRAVKMGWNLASQPGSPRVRVGLGWNYFANFNMGWFL